MALLTKSTPSYAGATPTWNAVSASDTVNVGDGAVFLHVKNGNAADCIVNVVVPGTTRFGQAEPDVSVTVPLSVGEKLIGPIGTGMADPTTNLVTVTFSVQTTVTCAVIAYQD